MKERLINSLVLLSILIGCKLQKQKSHLSLLEDGFYFVIKIKTYTIIYNFIQSSCCAVELLNKKAWIKKGKDRVMCTIDSINAPKYGIQIFNWRIEDNAIVFIDNTREYPLWINIIPVEFIQIVWW